MIIQINREAKIHAYFKLKKAWIPKSRIEFASSRSYDKTI